LFCADAQIAEFEKHAPAILASGRDAVARARCDLGFTRLDPEAWTHLDDISIDYAVMEKAESLSVVPYAGARGPTSAAGTPSGANRTSTRTVSSPRVAPPRSTARGRCCDPSTRIRRWSALACAT
jgi:hypothetical protein